MKSWVQCFRVLFQTCVCVFCGKVLMQESSVFSHYCISFICKVLDLKHFVLCSRAKVSSHPPVPLHYVTFWTVNPAKRPIMGGELCRDELFLDWANLRRPWTGFEEVGGEAQILNHGWLDHSGTPAARGSFCIVSAFYTIYVKTHDYESTQHPHLSSAHLFLWQRPISVLLHDLAESYGNNKKNMLL